MKASIYVIILISCIFLGCTTFTEGFDDGTTDATFNFYPRNIPNEKNVYVILPFKNESRFELEGLEHILRRYVEIGMVRTKIIDVVDRDHTDSILNEMEFQLSGFTNSDTVLEIGNILNAKYGVTGSLLEYSCKSISKGTSIGVMNASAAGVTGANTGLDVKEGTIRVALEIKIIDLETGKVVNSYLGDSQYLTKSFSTDVSGFNSLVLAFTNGAYLTATSNTWIQIDETVIGKTMRKAVINGLNQFVNDQS